MNPEYTCEVTNPKNPDQQVEHTFDLTQCPFKTIPEDIDYSGNSFDFETPIGKNKIKFKLITGVEEKQLKKIYNKQRSLDTTLKYQQDFVILLLKWMEIISTETITAFFTKYVGS